MKNIILFLLLIPLISHAQQNLPPVGSPNSLSTFKGGVSINESIFVPIKDTIPWFGKNSDFIRRTNSNLIYFYDGQKYQKIGSAGEDISSMIFTGDETKTLTLTRDNGEELTAMFQDNDNQTLSLDSKILSISGGNAVQLPIYFDAWDVFENSTSSVKTLTNDVDFSQHLAVVYNTAMVAIKDFTVNQSTKQVTLNFPVSSSDYIVIYYKKP